jgi:hypothetical protein
MRVEGKIMGDSFVSNLRSGAASRRFPDMTCGIGNALSANQSGFMPNALSSAFFER